MKNHTTKLAASEFIPDFNAHKGFAVANEHAYYLGVLGTCPVAQINCGGLNFPMRNDVFRDDPSRPGKKMRVGVVGGQNNKVNAHNIAALRTGLKRLVIRFTDEPAQLEERGTGKNTRAPHQKGRRGKIIRIPTPEQMAEAREAGVHVPVYVRQPNDEPAARYMYMHPCPDQAYPERGHDFTTIEEGGIFWPGELDNATPESILS